MNSFEHNFNELQKSLIGGYFKPTSVLGAEIPKDNGGVRQLGIPTVVGRVVQQAILQVIERLFEPPFYHKVMAFVQRKVRIKHYLKVQRVLQKVSISLLISTLSSSLMK